MKTVGGKRQKINFPDFRKKIRKRFTNMCSNFEIGAVQRIANLVVLEKNLMLQNAYLDAKIGFDAEENEPSKVWRFG